MRDIDVVVEYDGSITITNSSGVYNYSPDEIEPDFVDQLIGYGFLDENDVDQGDSYTVYSQEEDLEEDEEIEEEEDEEEEK